MSAVLSDLGIRESRNDMLTMLNKDNSGVCSGCGCCGDCDACTVVCVACVFAVRLLGCEGDGNAGVEFGGAVVVVSVYMGGTRGSGVLASAGDVLEMSVVRGVGGVCDMCMSLTRGGVGGVRCERIGFGLYQSWRNMGKVGYVFVLR